jgi:predicted amidohydrolase YtcJ
LLAGSSDWYITSLNILDQLQAAISHHNPQEKLSLEQAIQIYTINASRLVGNDSEGFLKVGNLANMTVLKNDPFTKGNFLDNSILAVISLGELIHV